MSSDAAPRVVAVGGGHGLAATLRALVALDLTPTAVVTVADDGGSSGRLRRDHGVIALGDLRMALLALGRRRVLADALALRFQTGDLSGHAVGNLLLLALIEDAGGDVVAALDRATGLLACRGRVLPCTLEPVTLRARVDGREVDGQVTVMTTPGVVEALRLEPAAPAGCPDAVKAIDAADVVFLGPGSLYTSVIPNLLVPDIAAALARTTAPLVHVANLTTQPTETDGMDADAHVRTLVEHLGGRPLDVVIHHAGPEGGGPGTPLGPPSVGPDVRRVIAVDLADRASDGRLRHGHDPLRLAEALRELVPTRP